MFPPPMFMDAEEVGSCIGYIPTPHCHTYITHLEFLPPRFMDAEEVALLARSMRCFDIDGVIIPESADMGELIIKVRRLPFLSP